MEDKNYGDILFLKRQIYTDEADFESAKEYFTVLEEFSQSNFSPMDMIKIAQVISYNPNDIQYQKFLINWIRDEENSQAGSKHSDRPRGTQFELLIFYEWGEPDCIDLERLTNAQTLKFLKNICEILKTTHKATS